MLNQWNKVPFKKQCSLALNTNSLHHVNIVKPCDTFLSLNEVLQTSINNQCFTEVTKPSWDTFIYNIDFELNS